MRELREVRTDKLEILPGGKQPTPRSKRPPERLGIAERWRRPEPRETPVRSGDGVISLLEGWVRLIGREAESLPHGPAPE